MPMRPSRTITIADLPTSIPDKRIRVCVCYNKGGACFLAGTSEPRGYELSVAPVTVCPGQVIMIGCGGSRAQVEAADRFSQRRLEKIARDALKLPLYGRLLGRVLTKNKLTLIQPEQAAA